MRQKGEVVIKGGGGSRERLNRYLGSPIGTETQGLHGCSAFHSAEYGMLIRRPP